MSDLLALWHDGQLVDGSLVIDPAERGLLLGDGLFETIAVFGGEAAWRTDHLDRMMKGAEAFGIPIARKRIEEAIAAVLDKGGNAHAILRVTLSRGPTSRGLAVDGDTPGLFVALSPWRKKTLFAPARLATSSVRRNEGSPAARHKTLSYADNILAAREVASRASDALMLNNHGRIASAASTNVFLLEDSLIVTPPIADGALPGITRKQVLDLAFTLGFDTVERSITPEEAASADLVFLTNSLRLIAPVSEIDGAPGGNAEALRLLFERLCERIADETGTDPRAADA